MQIRKEVFNFDKTFPFEISDNKLPPFYNMEGMHHWHECLEISYVKSGTGRYYIEDRVYEIEPGDIIVINNIEPHYLEVDDKGMHQPVIIFEPSLVWSDCGNLMDYEYLKPFFDRGTDFCNKLDNRHPLTGEIMQNLTVVERECREKPEGYRLMVKARLLVILTYLIRSFRDSVKTGQANFNKRQHLDRLEEVLKYITENFHRDIRQEEMAAKMFVSSPYFSAFFKKTTGVTFVEYVNRIRINKAIRMLGETNHKITRIAMECGFNNIANFNSLFKKYTGKTPSDYRG